MNNHEFQIQMAESAERTAEKCDVAGNRPNAAFFRRLARAHRELAAALASTPSVRKAS